ncbi:MAG: hypothetical protein H6556_00405 [Lewinellaceae bacterium]|nr:hypothetical protein [Lewinellaceae bacterium]
MNWTYPKITALAPNSLVLEKAMNLSSPRRWASIGSDGGMLWGECKSSGDRHYHTAANLADESFRCDCQSRYHPCRHILALLLCFVKKNHQITLAEAPPHWVQQLLKTPPGRLLTAEERARNEAERSRRFGQRLALMEQGARELEEWLQDLIRHGLSAIDEQPAAFWDGFAARMVDAKLGGVARRIRNFKALAGREEGFELLLEEMSELYLLAQSFKQLESLPEGLQEEVLSQMGVNRKREEILAFTGISDTWLVVGQAEGESEEDNLSYRRTWFLGETSSRMALLLDFSWGRQGYDMQWAVGSSIEGELVFYPGAFPLRALFRNHRFSNRPFMGKSGYATISDFARAYAQALAANPWLQAFPCLLAEATPVMDKEQVWLVDSAGNKIPVSSEGPARWNLLAVSGGRRLTAFGEWDGKTLNLLSAIMGERVMALQGRPQEPGKTDIGLFGS